MGILIKYTIPVLGTIILNGEEESIDTIDEVYFYVNNNRPAITPDLLKRAARRKYEVGDEHELIDIPENEEYLKLLFHMVDCASEEYPNEFPSPDRGTVVRSTIPIRIRIYDRNGNASSYYTRNFSMEIIPDNEIYKVN